MNSIEEFRSSLHQAVDDEPTSVIDAASVTSGALRRHRRRMAAGAAGVAGLAVVALGASAQTAATVATPATNVAQTPESPSPFLLSRDSTPIAFQTPDLSLRTKTQPLTFKTERGDTITMVVSKLPTLDNPKADVSLQLSDGLHPAQNFPAGAEQIVHDISRTGMGGFGSKKIGLSRSRNGTGTSHPSTGDHHGPYQPRDVDDRCQQRRSCLRVGRLACGSEGHSAGRSAGHSDARQALRWRSERRRHLGVPARRLALYDRTASDRIPDGRQRHRHAAIGQPLGYIRAQPGAVRYSQRGQPGAVRLAIRRPVPQRIRPTVSGRIAWWATQRPAANR